MRRVIQRSFLFIATFAALFLMCSQDAHAQQPPPFPTADCNKTMQQALYKGAQDYYGVFANVFANAQLPNPNGACFNINGLIGIINTLGALTSGAAGLNIFAAIWGIVWNTIIVPMINTIIQQACRLVSSAINAAVSLVKNSVCLPMPGIGLPNFNLGTFSGGSCNGVALMPLLAPGAFGPPRTAIPGVWHWNSMQ